MLWGGKGNKIVSKQQCRNESRKYIGRKRNKRLKLQWIRPNENKGFNERWTGKELYYKNKYKKKKNAKELKEKRRRH